MRNITAFIILSFCTYTASVAQTQVTMYTNHGNIVAQMYDSLVPLTVGNFVGLADTGYYDGVIFHRIIPGFVIQGGDPTGTGSGGPGWTIPDEFDSTLQNIKKTMSMANSGPNSAGSQFFINLQNNYGLDFDKTPLTSAHAVFGIVRSDWNIVVAIAQVPTDGNDRPINDVIMDSVRITGSYLTTEQTQANKTKSAIYPNPVTNQSVLDVYNHQNEWAKISITNTKGELIWQGKKQLVAGKKQIPLYELTTQQLKNGTYFISITSSKTVQTLKFSICQ